MLRIMDAQGCLVCKQPSFFSICEYCKQDLVLFDCEQYEHNLMFFPKVKRGLVKVDFPQVLALSDYQWPLSKLLTGLKFSARIPNAYALSLLFHEKCLASLTDKPQLIIPLPLHKNRYLFRKFNQSIELAKHISALSKITMDTSIIYRQKSTKAQTDLTSVQRRENLSHAFAMSHTARQRLQTYEHIVLLDDVITTGTTMNCAYNLLRKQHPTLRIDVWAICITLQH